MSVYLVHAPLTLQNLYKYVHDYNAVVHEEASSLHDISILGGVCVRVNLISLIQCAASRGLIGYERCLNDFLWSSVLVEMCAT